MGKFIVHMWKNKTNLYIAHALAYLSCYIPKSLNKHLDLHRTVHINCLSKFAGKKKAKLPNQTTTSHE